MICLPNAHGGCDLWCTRDGTIRQMCSHRTCRYPLPLVQHHHSMGEEKVHVNYAVATYSVQIIISPFLHSSLTYVLYDALMTNTVGQRCQETTAQKQLYVQPKLQPATGHKSAYGSSIFHSSCHWCCKYHYSSHCSKSTKPDG